MIKKRGGVEAPPSKLELQRRLSKYPQKCQVAYYPQGVALRVSCPIVKKEGGGIRGDIKEWSSGSRRRFRECLLIHSAPPGWLTLGVSLSVPGPPLTVTEMRQLWDKFRYAIKDYPIGLIWRLEIQERGAVHWHLLFIVNPAIKIVRSSDHTIIDGLYKTEIIEHIIRAIWLDALKSLGVCFHPAHILKKKNKRGEEKSFDIPDYTGLRIDIPNAWIHAIDIQKNGGEGSWLRYLQDHASKAKQEQIAVGFGRHWGMIGRQYFQKSESVSVDMPPKAYYRFLRAYRRMCTPSYPNKESVFGRSLGYRPSRGARGNSVWFSKPESVKRLQEWATSFDNA